MRFSFLLFALLTFGASQAQFHFKGQVSKDFANKEVHLSLVEDYRRTSRVYLDQIFQRTVADSLGHFSFTGNAIPEANRIYRIHVDACESGSGDKNHIMGFCPAMESILFIANNRDTLSLPLGMDQQAFCEIVSTNTMSAALLQLDLLKEELIVDILEQETEVAKNMTYKKWIRQFQITSLNTEEPLAELYGYNFLSNRENETYPYYLQDLQESPYYEGLKGRLKEIYPKASFTQQFQKELKADRTLIADEETIGARFELIHILYVVLGIAAIQATLHSYGRWKLAKNQNPFDALSAQERKVLNAILEGKSNKEIATDFFISLSTVKSHINSLYKKLGMSSRDEIFAYYKGKH